MFYDEIDNSIFTEKVTLLMYNWLLIATLINEALKIPVSFLKTQFSSLNSAFEI